MFPHMPTATWREAGGIYCAVTEDAMNLHRISKDLISDHVPRRRTTGQRTVTYLEFKNFTARDHRAGRLPMAPMQTPRPTRRNSILGKGTRPAGGHTVPQQGRSIPAPGGFIGPNGYTNGYSGYYEVVPVVPVGPDYTYGYSPAPAYGGYYVVP
jgi:hypothetical protein